MMDDRNGKFLPLEEAVEVDEAYVGGAPKSLFGAHAPRGRGASEPMVLVPASCNGQARGRVVPDGQGITLAATLADRIVPAKTTPMTDGNPAYIKIGQTMAGHQSVIHSARQYADAETGTHVNTAEAVISQVHRALVGLDGHGDDLVDAADLLGGPHWAATAARLIAAVKDGTDPAELLPTLRKLNRLLSLHYAEDLFSEEARRFMQIHPDDPRADNARICAEAVEGGLRALQYICAVKVGAAA